MQDGSFNILRIDASGRIDGSLTRALTEDLVEALNQRHGHTTLTIRDLRDAPGLVDQDWIAANFTPEDERSSRQRERLQESDELVAELKRADAVVIGSPIYNFGVPAALKAWVDMIARAKLTFRYTENGPEGLLKGKKAYLVIASGGVPIDSAVDFATPYLRQAMRFVGIDDIEVVAAESANGREEAALSDARARIAEVVLAAPRLEASAA